MYFEDNLTMYIHIRTQKHSSSKKYSFIKQINPYMAKLQTITFKTYSSIIYTPFYILCFDVSNVKTPANILFAGVFYYPISAIISLKPFIKPSIL